MVVVSASGRQRVRRKRRNEATGEEEVYHPFASEYCGFTLLLEHGGVCLRRRPALGTHGCCGGCRAYTGLL